MDSADLFDPEMAADARSGSELTALLVELARVLKGRGFYPGGDPRLASLFERGLRTWRGDLERHGELVFEVASEGFRALGSHEVLTHPQLAELHQSFRAGGIQRVAVAPWVDAEAFAGLVETLALPEEKRRAEGGALRALYARVPVGIVLNGTPPESMAPADAEDDEELAFVEEVPAPEPERPEGFETTALSPADAPDGADGPESPESPAGGPFADPASDEDPTGPTQPLGAAEADATAGALGDGGTDDALADFDVERFLEEDAREGLSEAATGEAGPDAAPPPPEAPAAHAAEAPPPAPGDPAAADEPAPFAPGETIDLTAGGERDAPFADGGELTAPETAPDEDLDARGELFGPAGAGPSPDASATAAPQASPEPALDDELAFGAGAPASAVSPPSAAGAPSAAADEELTFGEGGPGAGPAREPGAAGAEALEEIELLEPTPEAGAGAGTAESPGAPAAGGEAPSFEELEAAPLERGVVDDRSAALVDLLRELHDCDETTGYLELCRKAAQQAERAAEEGRHEDAYRVMLVLSSHASGRGKRAERQCEVAQEFLGSLARGERLEQLIDRACAPRPDASVRATQILLQCGEEVVPALLGAAVLERDAERRGQMHGVLIAMGEKTLSELLRAMDADDPELVRTAVRLAGETQNPGAIAKLSELLRGSPGKAIREEAAKALVRVGTPRAIELLVRAIDDPKVGDVAIYCLGACGSARPVEPLVEALHAAIDAGRLDRAREIIRSLGRLGRAEAVPALAELLLRRSVLGRRKLREVKLAAATALAGLPGDEAVGALAQAARSRDPQLRRVAQTALDRRARSLARGASA